jgi:chromosome segregation ATPase
MNTVARSTLNLAMRILVLTFPLKDAIAVEPTQATALRMAQVAAPKAISSATARRLSMDIADIKQIKDFQTLQETAIATAERADALQSEIDKRKADLKKLTDQIAEQNAKLEQATARLAAIEAEMHKKEKALEAAQLEFGNKKKELDLQISRLSKEKDEMAANSAHQSDEIRTLSKRIEALSRDEGDLNASTAALRAEKKRLEEETAKLDKELGWSQLLVKIFSGSTVAGAITVLGFLQQWRKASLENDQKRIEIEQLRATLAGKA